MNSPLVPQLGLVRVSDSPLTRKTKPTNGFLIMGDIKEFGETALTSCRSCKKNRHCNGSNDRFCECPCNKNGEE